MARTTISGVGRLNARLKLLPNTMIRRAREAVAAEVGETADDMRSLAPVDTGALVDGIQEQIAESGDQGTVRSTAAHSGFVNDGTRKQDAQPFASAAGDLMVARFPGRVVRALNGSIREVAK